MGNNIKKYKENKLTKICMDARRNFGVPPGQVVERDPITPTLFMQVGTRIGTITAYYEYVNSVNTPATPTITVSANPSSVVKIPIVQTTAPFEQVVPFPESSDNSSVYDIPKTLVARKN